MFLTEYNEEKVMEKARMEGVKEGIEKGADLERERVAADLIKEGGMSAFLLPESASSPRRLYGNWQNP